jgi:hypothetical protein
LCSILTQQGPASAALSSLHLERRLLTFVDIIFLDFQKI